MKKNFIAILVAILSLVSCEQGYLDTNLNDQANLDDIFSQTGNVRSYLSHIYSYIPLEEDNTKGAGWVVARGGQALFSWYDKGNYTLFRTGNYSAATMASDPEAYYDIWEDLYEGMHQCDIFLANIDKDKVDSKTIRDMLRAEAIFLKVYYCYCLVRQWGPVFIPENGKGVTDRECFEDNIKWMEESLDEAIPYLANSMADVTEGVDKWQGRATKGAAMALKARILTMAASPLYNGCPLYVGQMKNSSGEFLFPQAADRSKWDEAAQACKDVIDLNLYSLCKSTATGDSFKDAAASYQQVFFIPWNTETIWGWWLRTSNAYSSSAYSSLGALGSILACQTPKNFGKYAFSGTCPSLRMVDSYAMYGTGRYPVKGYEQDTDGNDYSNPVIDQLSGYVSEGWTENYKQPVDADWAPAFKAHNSCVGREPRFYACLVPEGFYWPNKDSQNNDGRFTCYNDDASNSCYSVTGVQHCRSGYAWRRNYPADTPLETGNDYTSLTGVYPEIRLAEIYLSYAEACNEKTSRDEATAIEYLNKVRMRSGLNDIRVAYPEVEGNQALLRELIRRERQVEFAMEPLSYYDALRWMTAEEDFPAANWTLKCSADNYEESYQRVCNEYAGAPAVFEDRDYLYPISHKWLQQTPQMTQNYGF